MTLFHEVCTMIRTVTHLTRNINYTRTNRTLGFIAHWKLVFSLWGMALNVLSLFRTFSPLKSIYMIPWTYIVLIIKTPWWMFIKPFGKIYSRKTTWIGTYEQRNKTIVNSDVRKNVTHKLFGIPFLKHPSSMTQVDWDYVGQ